MPMNEDNFLKAIQAMDKCHDVVPFFDNPFSKSIWGTKYKYLDEKSMDETIDRVVDGIFEYDLSDNEFWKYASARLMRNGVWMPAGRILAGAGTAKRVTLVNCFVNGTVEDDLASIMRAHSDTMLTMQMGGGMGTDFSTLRPKNAWLTRTHSKASGPLPFMDMWDAGSQTIQSAGDRSGAMMGTISDTHPDMPAFVTAKQQKGRMQSFNVSVLVSEAFMDAIKEDEDWPLYFPCKPFEREEWLADHDFIDDEGVQQYVYSVWKARDLWDMITRNTYDWSEPGIIFIDRVNELNNLHYCEEIRCTNPCGEQPLPPHGACNLGASVLSRLVINPFSDDARMNWDLLEISAYVGQRFLDNVIDVSAYPLPQQEEEQRNKRRTGNGISGLADALHQLGIRYGSYRAQEFAEEVMRRTTLAAYRSSVDLAKERGSFPLFDADGYLAPHTFAGRMLPDELKADIRKHGIRNGVLMTIAPTGTTSCVYGDIESGVEPSFELEMLRNIRQGFGDNYKQVECVKYSARLWKALKGDKPYPSHMVTTSDLSLEDHLTMQSRMQRWVDASISKTINLPEDLPYEQFTKVYDLAYSLGAKGCTTYRPSDVRGSILVRKSDTATSSTSSEQQPLEVVKRPPILKGTTYQLKWPPRKAAIYLVINALEDGTPFEIFITSKDGSEAEWTTALTLMITAIFKKGGDPLFLCDELMQIQSVHGGAFIGNEQRYFDSLPAYIGYTIRRHLSGSLATDKTEGPRQVDASDEKNHSSGLRTGRECPSCHQPYLIRKEGCDECTKCAYSKCG